MYTNRNTGLAAASITHPRRKADQELRMGLGAAEMPTLGNTLAGLGRAENSDGRNHMSADRRYAEGLAAAVANPRNGLWPSGDATPTNSLAGGLARARRDLPRK